MLMRELTRKIKETRCPCAAAVIVAGGSGTRFGSDKLLADLGGTPVLARSLLAFQNAALVREIVLAARPDALGEYAALRERYGITKLTRVVPGGKNRTESCFAGVMAVSEEAGIIAIHDGARPLVTEKLIEDAIWAAYRHGAAAPATPLRDTVKRARASIVTDTPDRKELFAVQTPQCFQADLIRGALADALKNGAELTDDCMAVERIGGQIWLTEGSEENRKITTPLDLDFARLILDGRESE